MSVSQNNSSWAASPTTRHSNSRHGYCLKFSHKVVVVVAYSCNIFVNIVSMAFLARPVLIVAHMGSKLSGTVNCYSVQSTFQHYESLSVGMKFPA